MLRWLPLVLIAVAGFWLRTHDLARRPMHADEANQAVKVGELLEAGHYAFDPRDHHGPTLYYAAVPIAWARGQHTLAQLTETTVRLVPAIFGTLTILLVAALAAPLGRSTAIVAAACVAVSPPALYYSRYFIQETLLVAFTLATFLCARRWHETRLSRWALAVGAGVGLMQATKASAPLFLALGLLAGLIASRLTLGSAPAGRVMGRRAWWRDVPFALLGFVLTAGLLYSSFGTHLSGVRDALAVYGHAFARFGAEAAPTGHEKPWWYYLRIFGWHREGGLLWHQLLFSAVALVGAAAAWRGPSRFARGVVIYTAAVIAAFSLFAYKTPWHAVHFVPGLALLAAVAVTPRPGSAPRGWLGRAVAAVVALGVVLTLYQQAVRSSFLRPADQRNPFAYVHSAPDSLKFRALALAAQERNPGLPVRVVSEEYWPLPWYLRGLPRVGYYGTVPDDCDGALVIASQAQAEAVRARLHGPYRETFLGLRPGFVCVLFTREP